jgi:hypothetical protein
LFRYRERIVGSSSLTVKSQQTRSYGNVAGMSDDTTFQFSMDDIDELAALN